MAELHQQGCARRRCVFERAEDIAADREVGDERCKLGPPFACHGIMRAIAVLRAGAEIDGVTRVERLAIMVQREDRGVADRSCGEAVLKLTVYVPSVSARPIDLVGGKEVAVR